MAYGGSRAVSDQATGTSGGWDIQILHLTRVDWALLRMVRLGALQDSPRAFTSSYEHEVLDDEVAWRQRFDSADWLVAVDHGQAIGLASVVHPRAPSGDHYIESVWVAPRHRRGGVLRSLVGRLAQIGGEAHVDALFLWVAVDNVIALCAYARLGFRPTEDEQPFGTATGRVERRLRLGIRP